MCICMVVMFVIGCISVVAPVVPPFRTLIIYAAYGMLLSEVQVSW